MTVFNTATEILSANNEIIHAMRAFVVKMSFSMRLSSDFDRIQRNVNRLQKTCQNNKIVSINFGDLASAARKVVEMESFLTVHVEREAEESYDDENEGVELLPASAGAQVARKESTAEKTLLFPAK